MRRDQAIVEGFLSAYNRHHGTSFKVARWPDVSNRQTQAVEAVASNDAGETIALEHTLIEPFAGERSDTDRFLRVFARLEGSPDLVKPGHDMDIIVKVHTVPTGVKWDETGELVRRHLASRIPSLKEGRTSETITEVKFPLEVTIVISPHDPGERGHVFVSRSLPEDSLEAVVRRALERKLPKLVNERADRRILLLEKADIARGITEARAAIDRIADDFPLLKEVDEIWLAITHCWESDSAVFFYELLPDLGNRRLKIEGFSPMAVRIAE
jgi:hypothetical protein